MNNHFRSVLTTFGVFCLFFFSLTASAQQAGSLDTTFDLNAGVSGNFLSFVTCIALQQDNKILVGGMFSEFYTHSRNNIARANSDGSIDVDFNSFGLVASKNVSSLAVQPDGKILIGGYFKSYDSYSFNNLVRVNIDGSFDTNFNIGSGFSYEYDDSIYSVCNINSIGIQKNGKIIVSGQFSSYNGVEINNIARLNEDGTLDNGFNIGNSGTNVFVSSVALQADGKILIGGNFDSYNGIVRNGIARLNIDGSLDTTFNIGTGVNDFIQYVTLQSDGKILIGGYFDSYNGVKRNKIARLNEDGSLDENFNPGLGASHEVGAIAVQSDGKIIIGGAFTSYNGISRSGIARLDVDGSLDLTFNPGTGANNIVNTIALQPDGKILIGGWFTLYNGESRYRIARLNGDCMNNSTSQAPICQGGTKALIGTSAGAWSVISGGGAITDTTYTHSGNSTSVTIRHDDGQCYQDIAFPVIPISFSPSVSNISNIIQCANKSLFIKSSAQGGATNYTWKKDGQELAGKHDSVLFVSNLNLSDAGIYQLEVGFACGAVLSKSFEVRVIDTLDCGKITGKVQVKTSCAGTALFPVSNAPLMLTGNGMKRYTTTNEKGDYVFYASPGSYKVEYLKKLDACNTLANVSIVNLGDSIANVHFSDSLPTCPTLALSIATGLFRQARPSTVALHYSNKSGFSAQNVKIRLKISELFEVTNTTHPIASTSPDGELEFDLGDLGPYQLGQIRLDGTVSMSASALIQSSLCFEGEIEASNLCVPAIHPGYSGASIAAQAECMQDGVVQLSMHDAGTAAMPDSSEYRVFVDSLLVFKGKTRLAPADTHHIQVPADGRTVRLEADQVAFHPLNKKVNVTVHGCGAAEGTVLQNNTNMFALLPFKPTEATACRAVTGSYDPNDKRAVPEGVTSNNYLPTGSNKLDFTIRFQNTGNDTAFLVRITDTLSQKLDLSTFTPGASSHDYTYEIMGEENPVIQWIFDDIYLPDSTTDSDGSNGFVSFSIRNYDSLPEFTTIENYADIYFDFNPPIRTDTVVRTIHDYVEIGKMSDLGLSEIITSLISQSGMHHRVTLYPNPAGAQFTVSTAYVGDKKMEVMDLTGRVITTRHFTTTQATVSTEQMAKGVYILRLIQGTEVSTHKLVVE